MEDLALSGGTVYVNPTEEPIRDGIVSVEAGRIAAVGTKASLKIASGVHVVDCSGLTVTAGFWNSHVHFFERKWAKAETIPAIELARQLEDMLTRYGFTSTFDLSSQWENTERIRDRIESAEVPGPRIRSTGPGLLPVNPGLPTDPVLHFMGVIKTAMAEVADAEQASAAVRSLLDRGVDGVKLFISAPSKATIPEAAIVAAVREAHGAGKPVFVHPNTAADIVAALHGGVDVIGHTTPASGAWDDSMIRAMQEHRVALTPTLTLWKYYMRHDRASVQDRFVDTSVGQLRAWVAAGGTVLFGTDLGAVDYDPSDEYSLMSAAGMNFRQVLASLTTAPAMRFGESHRLGRIATGFAADLVVFQGDPLHDRRALTAVRYTLRDGRIIYQARE